MNIVVCIKQVPDKQPLVREFKPTPKSEKSEGYVIPDIPMPEPFEKSRQGEWKKELKPVFKQESFVTEKAKRDETSPLIKSEVYAPLVSTPASTVNLSELNKSLENKNSFDNVNKDEKFTKYTHIESVEEKGTAYKKISDYSEEEMVNKSESITVEHDSNTNNNPSSRDFKGGILAKKALPDIKIIGQIFGTYWIMEYDGNVYMIDQHAAHEKVMYEKFVKEISANKVTSQNLLPPVVVTLSGSQRQIVEEISEHLRQIGFEIEPFGGNEYVIKAVPTELFGISEKEMLFDIIDQYSLEGKKATPDTVLSKLATMACKAAIKGNMNISLLEAKALIEELMSLDNPYNCPHGRPTMIFMSKSDVEKKFKRQI